MKDTIVTARRKKIELITLLVCFVVSNLLHLYAIIAYHAPFTDWHWEPVIYYMRKPLHLKKEEVTK